MSQLKPGMGCTLDGAAPDNKAVQRGNGRGGIEEGCPREKENCREKEIPGESERERVNEGRLCRGDGDGKCWTIERRPLGSELCALGYGTWSMLSGFCVYPKLN